MKKALFPFAGELALAALPDRLLVGVSGGVDSVALLHALVKTGKKPVVLYFDHGWRAQSAADGRFVHALARKLGLKFHAGKMKPGPQKEASARAARYAFFARTATRLGIVDIVLAHHADDQVETFLLQLLRGGGASARGMDGISHRAGLALHRPWLACWKKEITAYARREKLAWREDVTNQDVAHRRNLIRARVLPYLSRQIAAGVPENLWRAAEILRAEGEWLDALCATEAKQAELAVKTLQGTPVARQRRTILRWLQGRGIADIGFADVEAVRGLLENVVPAKINLSAGRFARRRSGVIFVE